MKVKDSRITPEFRIFILTQKLKGYCRNSDLILDFLSFKALPRIAAC